MLAYGGSVVTNRGARAHAQAGVTFEQLGLHRRGALLALDGVVAAVGDEAEVRAAYHAQDERRRREVVELDLAGRVLLPGFVDAHAHPLYMGDREPDFVARTHGDPPPLGAAYTIERTRAAGQAQLEETLAGHLRTMLLHGTTSAEVKTGYDLRIDGELALLRTIVRTGRRGGMPRVVPTLTGPHAHAPEYPDDDAFVDALIAGAVPYARAAGAVYADAFCEPGWFTVAQARRYLVAAREHGLRLRLHCDEFADAGAAALAAELAVDAADHLNAMAPASIPALARAGTVAVLCPATAWHMGVKEPAPARAMLEAGMQVALATDFNPGTAPSPSLQMAAHLGRRLLRLTAAEALAGVTSAAAHSLRLDAGTLEPGACADAVVMEMHEAREFGWIFGANLAAAVVRAGEIIG
ncbi:MAG: amidohydrolase family protein [bacterium]|nr:amidohydrolase family protein [bacterium]